MLCHLHVSQHQIFSCNYLHSSCHSLFFREVTQLPVTACSSEKSHSFLSLLVLQRSHTASCHSLFFREVTQPPVTACSSERSHSSPKRIKTSIRSRMTNGHLVGLSLLHLHRVTPILISKAIDDLQGATLIGCNLPIYACPYLQCAIIISLLLILYFIIFLSNGHNFTKIGVALVAHSLLSLLTSPSFKSWLHY